MPWIQLIVFIYKLPLPATWGCHTQLIELDLELASLAGQGKRCRAFTHVPKMVEFCLKVGP